MSLFDCLEDRMSELELSIIESLAYSDKPDLSHNALLSFVLAQEINSSRSYLTTAQVNKHVRVYHYINDLYIGRYIEQYGHEPSNW